MSKMWWSHINGIDFKSVQLPTISGAEPDPVVPGTTDPTGGAGAGEQQGVTPAGSASDAELDPQKKIAALTEEKDRHWTKAQEAAQKLSELEPELEELRKLKEQIETEKLSNEEKVQKQIEDLTKTITAKDETIAQLQESTKKLVLNNAFLTQTDVKWHNADRALALADLSAVEISEDKNGVPTIKNPDALQKAIKELATSDAYLVNTSEGAPSWSGKTGEVPAPKQKTGAAADREKLLKDYPALRR